MGMLNMDGQAAGAVEVGSVTANADNGAENLNDAATAADGQADSADNPMDAAAADTQQQQQQQVVWNGSEYVLKYRDKDIVPQSKDELIKWAQLGYNNDQRMRTLDQRESKLTQLEQQYTQLKQLSEAFDQRPDFKQAVLDIFQKLQSGQQSAAEQQTEQLPEGMQSVIAPYVDEIRQLKEELNGIKGRFQEFDNSKADEAVKGEIDQLKNSHTGEQWDVPDSATNKTLIQEVLEHAAKNNFATLEAAYRDLRWDVAIANAKAQALKSADENQVKEQKAGIVGKGGQGVSTAPKRVNVRSQSWNDLTQMAMADMK